MDYAPSKNNSSVGVVVTICDPVFLTLDSRAVNYEFLSFLVISRGSLHFDSVVSVTKFGQAETSHGLESINSLEILLMASSA